MHYAVMSIQADAYATCASNALCSVHAICTDRLALCRYILELRERYSLFNRLLSASDYGHCTLYAYHADLKIVHKARYVVESSSCVKELGPCEVLPRLDLILENYECTLQTTSFAVQI